MLPLLSGKDPRSLVFLDVVFYMMLQTAGYTVFLFFFSGETIRHGCRSETGYNTGTPNSPTFCFAGGMFLVAVSAVPLRHPERPYKCSANSWNNTGCIFLTQERPSFAAPPPQPLFPPFFHYCRRAAHTAPPHHPPPHLSSKKPAVSVKSIQPSHSSFAFSTPELCINTSSVFI